jgi:hypothetical protein
MEFWDTTTSGAMAMRQENFNNGRNTSQERGQSGQHMYSGQEPARCANCDIDILWSATVVQGITYCCAGCAAGGPCCCDYSQYRSVTISGVIHYGPDEEATKETSDKETS